MLRYSYMTRLRKILMTVALALIGAGASHALAPVTIETDWNWQTMTSSFTGVTSKTVDVAGFASAGYAVNGSAPNVIGFTYWVLPLGSSVTYTVSQTTKTYSSLAGNPSAFNSSFANGLYSANLAPAISTSAPMGLPAGSSWKDAYQGHFQAWTMNPVFTFNGLSTAATTYLIVEYGIQRRP